jgi:hypothetical protein
MSTQIAGLAWGAGTLPPPLKMLPTKKKIHKVYSGNCINTVLDMAMPQW